MQGQAEDLGDTLKDMLLDPLPVRVQAVHRLQVVVIASFGPRTLASQRKQYRAELRSISSDWLT